MKVTMKIKYITMEMKILMEDAMLSENDAYGDEDEGDDDYGCGMKKTSFELH